MVKKGVEDTILTINSAAEQTPNETKGIELAKKIFENHLSKNSDSVAMALFFVKNEIRSIF